MPSENKIRDAADAVKGIAEAVPVYQDVVQPAAKEIGTALQTVAKSVHVALAPVSALVWGYDKIKDYLNKTLTEKLKNVPQGEIIPPNPTIAGPAVEALRFAAHEPSLRELYANLLATSMDAKTAHEAHPSFVEIIKQLTPDEARLMNLFATTAGTNIGFPLITLRAVHTKGKRGQTVIRHFSLLGHTAGCEYPDLAQTYVDNLCRLGLVLIPEALHVHPHDEYHQLINHPTVQNAISQIKKKPGHAPQIRMEGLWLTNLGRQFCKSCIVLAEDDSLSARVPRKSASSAKGSPTSFSSKSNTKAKKKKSEAKAARSKKR